MPRQRFTFGPFLLNPDNGTLLRQGEPIAVGQKGIMLLEALLRRPGEVLSKAELLDAGWSGAAVEESNLSVQIASLRKLLGRPADGGEWIVTIPRVGYRFVGVVDAPKSAVASTRRNGDLPTGALDRDPALRQPQRRSGAGIFRRWSRG